MPAGRPTKYTAALLKKAAQYLDEYEDNGDAIPSIVGLALYLDIRRSTLYKWAEEKPEFSDILANINEKQEQVLISKGLKNEFNSNIVKLALGKHGYHDKQQTDNISSDGSMSPPTKIELVARDNGTD